MRNIQESFRVVAEYLASAQPNTVIEQWRPAWDAIATAIVDDGALVKTNELAAFPVETNAQTGTAYELVLADAGKVVQLSNAAPITLTVPTNANAAFPIGTLVGLVQGGAGTVTVAGDGGVTVNSLNGLLDLSGQYAVATLQKTAANVWLLYGSLM